MFFFAKIPKILTEIGQNKYDSVFLPIFKVLRSHTIFSKIKTEAFDSFIQKKQNVTKII